MKLPSILPMMELTEADASTNELCCRRRRTVAPSAAGGVCTAHIAVPCQNPKMNPAKISIGVAGTMQTVAPASPSVYSTMPLVPWSFIESDVSCRTGRRKHGCVWGVVCGEKGKAGRKARPHRQQLQDVLLVEQAKVRQHSGGEEHAARASYCLNIHV